MEDDVTAAEPARVDDDSHRSRAAHLYGLIITGAVLATASDEFRLARIAIILLGTLLIYFAAETYVHWMATRSLSRRPLTREERRQILGEGWPLVTACSVPLFFLALEGLLGVETALALDLALLLNTGLLFLIGWRMGKESGLTGWRLVISVAAAGLLGVALIVLKTLTH